MPETTKQIAVLPLATIHHGTPEFPAFTSPGQLDKDGQPVEVLLDEAEAKRLIELGHAAKAPAPRKAAEPAPDPKAVAKP